MQWVKGTYELLTKTYFRWRLLSKLAKLGSRNLWKNILGNCRSILEGSVTYDFPVPVLPRAPIYEHWFLSILNNSRKLLCLQKRWNKRDLKYLMAQPSVEDNIPPDVGTTNSSQLLHPLSFGFWLRSGALAVCMCSCPLAQGPARRWVPFSWSHPTPPVTLESWWQSWTWSQDPCPRGYWGDDRFSPSNCIAVWDRQ